MPACVSLMKLSPQVRQELGAIQDLAQSFDERVKRAGGRALRAARVWLDAARLFDERVETTRASTSDSADEMGRDPDPLEKITFGEQLFT